MSAWSKVVRPTGSSARRAFLAHPARGFAAIAPQLPVWAGAVTAPLMAACRATGAASLSQARSISEWSMTRHFSTEDGGSRLQRWSELNRKGMQLLQQGNASDYEAAEGCFREACAVVEGIPNSPHRILSLANLASCLVRRSKPGDAIHIFRALLLDRAALAKVPSEQVAAVYQELATALEMNGDLPGSQNELQNAYLSFMSACAKITEALANPPAQVGQYTPAARVRHSTTAMTAWRSAANCQFRTCVASYRLGHWDATADQLKRVRSACVCPVSPSPPRITPTAHPSPLRAVPLLSLQLIVDLDYMLQCLNSAKGGTLPVAPPPATTPPVTLAVSQLALSLEKQALEEYISSTTQDTIEARMSLGAVLLDMRLMRECVDAYVSACKTALDNDVNLFLRAIAEVSRTLRVAFEKLGDEREALREQLANAQAQGQGQSQAGSARAGSQAGDGTAANGGAAAAAGPGPGGAQTSVLMAQRSRALRGMEEIDRARSLLRPMLDKYAKLKVEIERASAERASRMNIPPELMEKLRQATEQQRLFVEEEQRQQEQDAQSRVRMRQERERERREQRLRSGESASVIKAEEMVDDSAFGRLTMLLLDDIEQNKRRLGIKDEDLVLDEDGTFVHKSDVQGAEVAASAAGGSSTLDPSLFTNTPELDHHDRLRGAREPRKEASGNDGGV